MPAEETTGIHCRLDELLEQRGMTLTELSKRVGVSLVNLSVLKKAAPRPSGFPPSPQSAVRWTARWETCW